MGKENQDVIELLKIDRYAGSSSTIAMALSKMLYIFFPYEALLVEPLRGSVSLLVFFPMDFIHSY